MIPSPFADAAFARRNRPLFEAPAARAAGAAPGGGLAHGATVRVSLISRVPSWSADTGMRRKNCDAARDCRCLSSDYRGEGLRSA
jgi:hypothetical protein